MTTHSVFFYGLFMDEALLREKGLDPRNGRAAHVDGWDLRIGQRAYVVRDPDATLWGIVFDLRQDELDVLYGDPSVRDYRPETLDSVTSGGEAIRTRCYNLPDGAPARSDDRYARELIALCSRLAFPQTYIDRLRQL